MPKSGSGDTPNYSLFETSNKHVLRDKFRGFIRQGSHKRVSLFRRIAHFSNCRALLGIPLFLGSVLGSASSAYAALDFSQIDFASISGFFAPPFGSVEIMMLAIFGGAMSFALLAANWLIRERSRISGENHLLKNRLSILRASHERTDALVNINDQCTVVWDGSAQTPEILGSLAATSGVPKDQSAFLAFGIWLKPDSASDFEKALKDLRLNAASFDLPLQTRSGGILEAQGRTSGGHAFVRFIELGSERAALAKLESDHVQLLSTIDSVQKLFEKMDMPIWLKDNEKKLFWANQAYANAVDASNGEAAVTQNIQLFDNAERSEITAGHQNSNHFSGRLPAVISGDRRMVDVVDITTDNGGAGIAIDRNDIEAIKTTLSKTIASHAVMLDQLATAVAIFDSSKRLQFANTSFQQLWALEPSLLEGNPTHGEILDAMLAGGKLPEQPDWRKWREEQLGVYQSMDQGEIWWHLPDGTTLRVISSPQEQGGATWTFENVTEQLALESNYNALIKVQGETLDHLHEAVAVFGSDGKLRLSNPAFSTMWEFDGNSHALEGCHVGDLLNTVRGKTGETEILDNIVREITGLNDERDTIDGRLELDDGTIVDVALVPLPQAQSMLTFTDKTDSIKVERALEQRAEALEASDQLKSKFIQHVSYELRVPLTSISGYGQMLGNGSSGTLSGKQGEYVDNINEASAALKAIVDDILDLATLDAGVLNLDMQEVLLKNTIESSLEGLQDEIDEHDLNVKIEITNEDAVLVADQERLQQILYNLISNAVNFSPDGGNIIISGKTRANMVEIAISDEGQGVPDNMKNTIFDRFESGGVANQRQGTGLGLSIVKSLVSLHGGRVFVESTDTGGARFVCQFPRNPEQKQSLDAAE